MRRVFFALAVAGLAGPAVAQADPRPEGSRVRGDTRGLFSSDDYPALARNRREEGTVQAELTVGKDGRVTGCRILRSSNSQALDTATCSILTRRARFTPARDRNGNPVEDKYVTPPVTWRLPSLLAAPPMQQTQPGRFACNAPAGRPLNQEIVPLTAGQELRVAFRLLREDPNGTHPAAAAVIVHTPGGASTIAVGRAVNDPFQMFAAVAVPGIKEDVLFEYPLTKNWIILKLSLDRRGFLTVRSNDLAPKFDLKTTAIAKTELHCNSGEWEIDLWPRSYVAGGGA